MNAVKPKLTTRGALMRLLEAERAAGVAHDALMSANSKLSDAQSAYNKAATARDHARTELTAAVILEASRTTSA